MLNLSRTYIRNDVDVSPYLRSFMNTYQVGIRNREAKSSALHKMVVVAVDSDRAAVIAQDIIDPYDMVVKSVTSPGDEAYGLGAGIDADPINKTFYDIDL